MDMTSVRHSATGLEILIVANYASADGSGNCRFVDLARRFAREGGQVELVTSNFDHDTHSFRTQSIMPENYQLTLVHERGYQKNISIARLLSQRTFARNVAKYLRARPTIPDLLYVATPPPDVAKFCAKYAQRHGIPLVVDIQDLWPEGFNMQFKFPHLINTVFRPMIRSGQFAYRAADLVVGVSKTYVEHAEKTAGKALNHAVVFLGANPPHEDEPVWEDKNTRSTFSTRLVYVGTLSHSYDLPMIMDAMVKLSASNQRFSDLELVVLGDGPMRADFEDYANSCGANVRFLGSLPYTDMHKELRRADIAVNPIVAGSMGSVLNKVGDYAAAGLPVINTQESPEYRRLLDEYNAGLNCATGDSSEVAAAIQRLVDTPGLREKLARNSLRMGQELFDRNKSYSKLLTQVTKLARRAPVNA